jgi:hypothetical protein
LPKYCIVIYLHQQTFVWLEKEGQGETDTFFSFSCQNDAHRNGKKNISISNAKF